MTTSHLVARLQLALHRDEHFDHLHHARGQIVTTTDFFDLVLKARIQGPFLDLVLLVQGFDDFCVVFVFEGKLPPLTARQGCQQVFGDFRVRLDAFGAFDSRLADDHRLKTRIDVAV